MVDEVTPEELTQKLDADEPVQVIDIRPPAAFEEGHIPGAQNVPMTQLPTSVDDIDWGEQVVVTCPIGQSSVQAARLIGSFEGVDDDAEVASLAGGYDAWEYELEHGTDA